jgi:predicted GTPase
MTSLLRMRISFITVIHIKLSDSGSWVLDLLTGQKNKRAGNSLKSCTDKIQAVRVRRAAGRDDRLVLIDTPGFDDTNKSDMVILQMIGDWLEKT